MDLNKEFKQVEEEKDNQAVLDDEESNRIIKELEEKLNATKSSVGESEQDEDLTPTISATGINTPVDDEEEDLDEEDEKTLLERLQPFIIPIFLTIFAVIFAGMFLYFFSKSRVQQSTTAITNSGAVEQVYIPPPPVQIIVKEEPLKCDEPQYLSEDGKACLDPVPESTPKAVFENGTTTIVNVRFSYDKYNYDNAPRGIYLLEDQIFEGEYMDYKIAPTNRAFANDHFFGIDRYMVSLIGDCRYSVEEAKILVRNMVEKDGYFTGNVVRVLDSSKPSVDCEK